MINNGNGTNTLKIMLTLLSILVGVILPALGFVHASSESKSEKNADRIFDIHAKLEVVIAQQQTILDTLHKGGL